MKTEQTPKTLREELAPLIPELDAALAVVGKAGEIIQRHTKSESFALEAGLRWNETRWWLRLDNDENADFHKDMDSVLSAAEAYKPIDPEEKKRKKIATLKAKLAELEADYANQNP